MKRTVNRLLIMSAPLLHCFPNVQFLCALIVGAVDEMVQHARGIREALKTQSEVSEDLAHARMVEGCLQCPMFYAPLGTCGSPLVPSPVQGLTGCFCHCATKAKTKTNCTAYDHYRGVSIIGWYRGLNSFPEIYDHEHESLRTESH